MDDPQEKNGLPGRKVSLIKKTFLGLVILGFVLMVLAVLLIGPYLRSAAFTAFVERKLEEGLGLEVSLARASLTWKPGLAVRDLQVTGEDGSPLLFVPHGEVTASLRSLREKRIESLVLRHPKFYLRLGKGDGEGAYIPPLLKRGSIVDGEIVVIPEGGEPLTVRPVNLFFEEAVPEERLRIVGETVVPLVETTLSFKAELDYGRVSLDQGRLDFGPLEIETYLRGAALGCTMVLEADISREGERLAAVLKGRLRNVGVSLERGPLLRRATAELETRVTLTPDYRLAEVKGEMTLRNPGWGEGGDLRASLNAAWDRRGRTLKIEEISLVSGIFGTLAGAVEMDPFPASPAAYSVDLLGKGISLDGVRKYLLQPLGLGAGLRTLDGHLSGSARLTGAGDGEVRWEERFSIGGFRVEGGSLSRDLSGKSLQFASSGLYSASDDSLELIRLEGRLDPFPPWHLRGTIMGMSTPEPELDLTLTGEEIPLPETRDALEGLLPGWLSGLRLEGSGRAEMAITGTIGSPRVKGGISISGPRAEYAGWALEPCLLKFILDYPAEGSLLREAAVEAGLVTYRPGGVGEPALSLEGAELLVPRFGLRDTVVELEGTRLRAGRISRPTSGGRSGLLLEKADLTVPLMSIQGAKVTLDGARLTARAAGPPAGGETISYGLENLELTISRMTMQGEEAAGEEGFLKAGKIWMAGKKENFRLALRGAALALPSFRRRGLQVETPGARLESAGVHLTSGGGERFALEDVLAAGDAFFDLEGRVARGSSITLDTSLIRGLTGDLTGRWGSGASLEASMEYPNLDLAGMRELLPGRFPLAEEYVLRGEGGVKAEVSAFFQEETPPRVEGRASLALAGGAFSSPDGMRVGEGIDLDLSAGFRFSRPAEGVSFSVTGEAGGFELLLGSFYGDFTRRKIVLGAEGDYNGGESTVNLERADLEMAGIGAVHFSGAVSQPGNDAGLEGEVRLADLSNSGIYDLFIRETFQEDFPWLLDLEVSGSTAADLTLKWSAGGFALRGALKVSGGGLANPAGDRALRGLDMDLPVNLHAGREGLPGNKVDSGSVGISSLTWGPLAVDVLNLETVVGGNYLHIPGEVALPLFEGEIILRDATLQNLLDPDRKISLSLALEDISLAGLTGALGLPGVQGRLSGDIPDISSREGDIVSQGEILLELFGGEMRINELGIENVLGPVPSWHGSVSFREIDLGLLTETFDFGRITGVLEGDIRDLVIAAGQAERFDARVETVKRKGVPQKISVEALEKVSILGSGAAAAALSRGVYQFFKEYRYSKMGFTAGLRNDKLTLFGIETIGDRSYLVKGGLLPPKANVISYTQEISFQEMLRRLKRVGAAGKGEGVRIE